MMISKDGQREADSHSGQGSICKDLPGIWYNNKMKCFFLFSLDKLNDSSLLQESNTNCSMTIHNLTA